MKAVKNPNPPGFCSKACLPPRGSSAAKPCRATFGSCLDAGTSVPAAAHICRHLSDPTSALLLGDLLNEAETSQRVSNPPWIGMGKPACSKSPGQLENPGFFLRALFVLLFCRHGKELHGQSHARATSLARIPVGAAAPGCREGTTMAELPGGDWSKQKILSWQP